jgi:hypothetical protein
MKRILSGIAISLVTAAPAIAGCSNYEDGSLPNTQVPQYQVCYDGVCDETTLSYECSNIRGSQTGFAIGWSIDVVIAENGDQTTIIGWQGCSIDEAKYNRLSVEEIVD